MPELIHCPHLDSALQVMGQAGKEIVLDARGTSMLPLIRQGDRLWIRPVQAKSIGRGDVFAFWEKGNVVVHRCLGKKVLGGKVWLCQKGDNLAGWSWVDEERVAGKVVRIVKSGRVLDLSAFPRGSRSGNAMAAFSRVWISIAESVERRARGTAFGGPALLLSAVCRRVVRAAQFAWSMCCIR